MHSPSREELFSTPYLFRAALVLACLGSLLWRMNWLPLRGEEPRRAIVAMEMLHTGEYLVPQIHESPYYNKPPVFNWLLAATFKATGSSDVVWVRLPGLIFFILTACAIGVFAGRSWGAETGCLAGLFFITSADLFFFGTMYAGEIDLFFAFLVSLQVLAIYHWEQAGKRWPMFLFSYLLMAIGVLTKGPPSLLFQGLTLLAWLLWRRKWRWLFHPAHAVAALVSLGLIGGYFLLYANAGGNAWGFMAQLFSEASQRTGFESHWSDTLRDSLLFPIKLVQLLLPWSLFVFLLFDYSRRKPCTWKPDAATAFIAVFVVANIGPYWFTGELRNRYIYMFLPFLAAALARVWTLRNPDGRLTKGLMLFLGALLILAAMAAPVAIWVEPASTLPGIIPLVVMMSIAFAALAWVWFRRQAWRPWTLIAAMIVARFGLDAAYIPLASQDPSLMAYGPAIEAIQATVGQEPLYWSGQPYERQPALGIGPIKAGTHPIQAPPLLDYALLYYLMQARSATVPYAERPPAGSWVLAPVPPNSRNAVNPADPNLHGNRTHSANPANPVVPAKSEVVYRFYDDWQRRDLGLYRIP